MLNKKLYYLIKMFKSVFGFFKKKESLSIGNDYFEALFQGTFDAVIVLDRELRVVLVNSQLEDIFMCKHHEVAGADAWSFFAGVNPREDFLNLVLELGDGYSVQVSGLTMRKRDESVFISDLKLIKMHSGNMIMVVRDLTERMERESVLIREAKSDRLTGLLNRKGLDERLSYAMGESEAVEGFKIGLLFIDLDEFKPINDKYGHKAGDELLCHVAHSLKESIPTYATAARIGGDEFICVLPVCESKEDLENLARDILKNVAREITADGKNVTVKCSIGGALYPDHAQTADSLVKSADYAMYGAKTAGKNQINILS